MQVDYADTVQKLSKFQQNVPLVVTVPKVPEVESRSANRGFVAQTEQQFKQSMKETIINERFINERKRLHNREIGRVAVVNEVSIFHFTSFSARFIR